MTEFLGRQHAVHVLRERSARNAECLGAFARANVANLMLARADFGAFTALNSAATVSRHPRFDRGVAEAGDDHKC